MDRTYADWLRNAPWMGKWIWVRMLDLTKTGTDTYIIHQNKLIVTVVSMCFWVCETRLTRYCKCFDFSIHFERTLLGLGGPVCQHRNALVVIVLKQSQIPLSGSVAFIQTHACLEWWADTLDLCSHVLVKKILLSANASDLQDSRSQKLPQTCDLHCFAPFL